MDNFQFIAQVKATTLWIVVVSKIEHLDSTCKAFVVYSFWLENQQYSVSSYQFSYVYLWR